jgi:hypothetical protein
MFNHISQNNDGGVSHFHTIALNSSADKVIRKNAPGATQVQQAARRPAEKRQDENCGTAEVRLASEPAECPTLVQCEINRSADLPTLRLFPCQTVRKIA